jgi:FtsP/CotA-like multicopper oxidase with cupredoxin domain
MDGVNGITECPIAPDQTKVYRFKATQYGTTVRPNSPLLVGFILIVVVVSFALLGAVR